MQQYRFTLSKLVSLLMIGFLLSIVAITLPPSFENNKIEDGYYTTGSDMTIMGIDLDNQTILEILKDDGIQSYSEIYMTSIIKQGDGNYRDPRTFKFLGIDPDTFAEVAYWENDYSENVLPDIVNAINDGKNDSIAVQENYLKSISASVNSVVGFTLSEETTKFDFTVKASFEMFPNLMFRLPYYYPWGGNYEVDVVQVLMTIDNLKSFSNQSIPGATISKQGGIYINLKDGVDTSDLKEKLAGELTGVHITIPEDIGTNNNFYDGVLNKILFSTLHSLIIVFIIVSITAFSYYSYISIQMRKKEIGIFRALGMIHKQIFRLFLFENLIILFSGLVVGTTLGLITTNIIFKIYTAFEGSGVGQTIPPFRVIIPFGIVVIFLLIIILLNLIAIIIPPRYLSKKQVGSILRMD